METSYEVLWEEESLWSISPTMWRCPLEDDEAEEESSQVEDYYPESEDDDVMNEE